ncbi:fimbrial protein [Serratia liquefaciens]|uniref:fimbrial protein n=1 Tax=Serratia liquefaciens TaxID=614 RepID=UPI00217C5BCF|nr:fimbrial protein [Serratia liquefaciens]CAI0932167.1 Type-1A pilin [Serratia liquefaciens]
MLSIDSIKRSSCRMGVKFIRLLIVVAGITALTPTWADLGVINFNMRATLIKPACSLSTDSMDKTVNLGIWSAKQFVETPSVLPLTRFTINLEDCGPTPGVKVTWSGTPHASNNGLFALTAGSTATNVGVELLDWNRNRIAPGNITPAYGFDVNAPRVSIPFYARYVRAGGTVTAGAANSMATFTLDYL